MRGALGSGRVPDQIPVLAGTDPHVFGMAVATVEGEVHGVGEWRRGGTWRFRRQGPERPEA